MTSECVPRPVLAELSDEELADGLTAGAVGERWSERAAVGLLVAHGYWLGRQEIRRAVEASLGLDGELFAWVAWDRVDLAGAGTLSNERRLLCLVCSLGGVPSDRPLSELLFDLDATDTVRVLEALWVACTGRRLAPGKLSS